VYPHRASLKNNEKPGVDIHSGTELKNPVWIYTQSITSQASYSPEYTTPTQKKS
jgi:hypothetical protein